MARTVVSIPTGGLSLILNGTIIDNFTEGEHLSLTFLNDLTSRLNGASDSVTITERIDANVCDMEFKVIRYSESDVFLGASYKSKPIIVFNGSLKEVYHTDQISDALENWTLESGTFTTPPVHVKNNQIGEFMVVYKLQFRNAQRVI